MILKSKTLKVKYKWTVVGHYVQKKFLELAVSENRLANIYLFLGPTHIGKNTLAKNFANLLVCLSDTQKPCENCYSCKLAKAVSPDIQIIDQSEEIKIDQIRLLQRNFSLKSFSNNFRIAIIANAENLNQEAANALLKIVEEPSEKLLFILTASHYSVLPPTIISRSQRIFFAPNTKEEFRHFFKGLNIKGREKQMARLDSLSLGKIGLAKLLVSNEEFFEQTKNNFDNYFNNFRNPLYERLAWSMSKSAMSTKELLHFINYWLWLSEKSLLDKDSKIPLTAKISVARAVADSIANLKYNMNKKLVLDNLMLGFDSK